ncbi:helix-turn-helix transcriptional regulator [Microbacterium esteraromaticum]|uniref:Helix-turn-helix transcriptional regulator n=1 Tax=Microbacterium esteraromaticum TaxID=57043 RepID=A0A7D7WJL4_9MICO|nr:helix-turn-helix domain-containing protein [Microbacterium esteraromaticum]QMU98030.1 helix-turn-helix transcriptional regulator [Microbacterium esteraromaticum]
MEEISVITAVHHPLRRRIVDHLQLHETAQVGALSRALDVQVGSISHHLRMLQRAGMVEQVDDPTGDRRTSWWRLSRRSLSWSSRDYADSPAAAYLAREAQRLNLRHQLERLQQWNRVSESSDVEAFSTDALAWATAQELLELQHRITEAVDSWRDGIDRADGQERMPVFFFAHGFPTAV